MMCCLIVLRNLEWLIDFNVLSTCQGLYSMLRELCSLYVFIYIFNVGVFWEVFVFAHVTLKYKKILNGWFVVFLRYCFMVYVGIQC